jgi:hypothetical protein
MKNIFFQWLAWHFWEAPREIVRAWKNFLKFNFNYFSVGLLLRTFFSPWRRYSMSYGRGLNIGRYIEVFLSNMIFRLIGVILRSFLIFFGLATEVFLFFLGIVVFFAWLLLPVLLVWGVYHGFRIFI